MKMLVCFKRQSVFTYSVFPYGAAASFLLIASGPEPFFVLIMLILGLISLGNVTVR